MQGTFSRQKSGPVLEGRCVCSQTVSLSVTDCWWGKECLSNTQSQPQTQPWGSRKTPVSESEVWREGRERAVCLFMPSKTNYLINIHVQYTWASPAIQLHPYNTDSMLGWKAAFHCMSSWKTLFHFSSFTPLNLSLKSVLHCPDEQMASGGVTTHLWWSGDTDCVPWLSQPLWRASSTTVGPPR